jgi:diaminopimelate epimerase
LARLGCITAAEYRTKARKAIQQLAARHEGPRYIWPVSIPFEKWEGLGNDFLIVSAADAPRVDARAVCDRHRGVGGDGVLVVAPAVGFAPASMRVLNADGSEPEMCGNGLRCAALHLVRAGFFPEGQRFSVDTLAGPHGCEVLDGARGIVRVEMRAPSLVPSEIPTTLRGAGEDAAVLDGTIEVLGHRLSVTAVSMGNPHAVTFDALSAAERALLGPAIEGATDLFPARVNAGFARLTGPRALELFVYERGAGWTQACGTGACAAAVAAVATGRIEPEGPIEVTLPGGVLSIEVRGASDPVRMTGPARQVFVGALPA